MKFHIVLWLLLVFFMFLTALTQQSLKACEHGRIYETIQAAPNRIL